MEHLLHNEQQPLCIAFRGIEDQMPPHRLDRRLRHERGPHIPGRQPMQALDGRPESLQHPHGRKAKQIINGAYAKTFQRVERFRGQMKLPQEYRAGEAPLFVEINLYPRPARHPRRGIRAEAGKPNGDSRVKLDPAESVSDRLRPIAQRSVQSLEA